MVKVSVVIATYNGEKFISEQLNSIFEQSRRPDEIIISDDFSTDRTIEIVKDKLKQEKIPFQIVLNKNKGVVNNFSNALKFSTGDFIFFSDQDDIWTKNKIDIALDLFLESPGSLLFFSNAMIFEGDISNFNRKESLFDNSNFFEFDYFKKNPLRYLLKKSVVTGATMAISKDLLSVSLPIGEFWMHDQWLALHASVQKKIIYTEERLIYYRQHSDNVVGAVNRNLLNSIKRFVNNTAQLKYFRVIQQKKMRILNQSIMDYTSKNYEIDCCLSFWNAIGKVSKKHIFKSFKIIFSQYKNGNYDNFYIGAKGAVRDFLSIFTENKEGK